MGNLLNYDYYSIYFIDYKYIESYYFIYKINFIQNSFNIIYMDFL